MTEKKPSENMRKIMQAKVYEAAGRWIKGCPSSKEGKPWTCRSCTSDFLEYIYTLFHGQDELTDIVMNALTQLGYDHAQVGADKLPDNIAQQVMKISRSEFTEVLKKQGIEPNEAFEAAIDEFVSTKRTAQEKQFHLNRFVAEQYLSCKEVFKRIDEMNPGDLIPCWAAQLHDTYRQFHLEKTIYNTLDKMDNNADRKIVVALYEQIAADWEAENERMRQKPDLEALAEIIKTMGGDVDLISRMTGKPIMQERPSHNMPPEKAFTQ